MIVSLWLRVEFQRLKILNFARGRECVRCYHGGALLVSGSSGWVVAGACIELPGGEFLLSRRIVSRGEMLKSAKGTLVTQRQRLSFVQVRVCLLTFNWFCSRAHFLTSACQVRAMLCLFTLGMKASSCWAGEFTDVDATARG